MKIQTDLVSRGTRRNHLVESDYGGIALVVNYQCRIVYLLLDENTRIFLFPVLLL